MSRVKETMETLASALTTALPLGLVAAFVMYGTDALVTQGRAECTVDNTDIQVVREVIRTFITFGTLLLVLAYKVDVTMPKTRALLSLVGALFVTASITLVFTVNGRSSCIFKLGELTRQENDDLKTAAAVGGLFLYSVWLYECQHPGLLTLIQIHLNQQVA